MNGLFFSHLVINETLYSLILQLSLPSALSHTPLHTHSLSLTLYLRASLFQQYGIGFLILLYGVCSVCSRLAASKHIALGEVTATSLTPNCCWVERLVPQLFPVVRG